MSRLDGTPRPDVLGEGGRPTDRSPWSTRVVPPDVYPHPREACRRRATAGRNAEGTRTNVGITAEPRGDWKRRPTTRRSGSVPAVIYGTGIDLTHVALDEHEINLRA